MSETIICPHCRGTGKAVLDAVLADARACLQESTPATSEEIYQRMAARGYRCGRTATMNQLAKLVKLGLARRWGKQGRFWMYRLP